MRAALAAALRQQEARAWRSWVDAAQAARLRRLMPVVRAHLQRVRGWRALRAARAEAHERRCDLALLGLSSRLISAAPLTT